MIIKILTLFPNFFESFINSSIIGRAISREVVQFEIIDIRKYSTDKNHRVDDRPLGGGAGLIMKLDPLVSCLKDNTNEKSHKILLTPWGKQYNQAKAIELSKKNEIVLICGHYEGVDSRFINYCDELISVGDYVMTGGEIGAMTIADSVVRLLRGAITDSSIEEESFNDGLLEYPQYTYPLNYDGYEVPEILLCGNHEAVAHFRRRESFRITKKYRPDLLENFEYSKKDLKILKELEEGRESKLETQAKIKGAKFIKR